MSASLGAEPVRETVHGDGRRKGRAFARVENAVSSIVIFIRELSHGKRNLLRRDGADFDVQTARNSEITPVICLRRLSRWWSRMIETQYHDHFVLRITVVIAVTWYLHRNNFYPFHAIPTRCLHSSVLHQAHLFEARTTYHCILDTVYRNVQRAIFPRNSGPKCMHTEKYILRSSKCCFVSSIS